MRSAAAEPSAPKRERRQRSEGEDHQRAAEAGIEMGAREEADEDVGGRLQRPEHGDPQQQAGDQ